MHAFAVVFCLVALLSIPGRAAAKAVDCVQCHEAETPGVVADWAASRHGQMGMGCATCHGQEHSGPDDTADALIPTPTTCAACHPGQVEQFSAGKHALGWASYKAMPTAHMQPMALMDGMKGCGGCHKIGLKTDEEIATLKAQGQGFGLASCDACHTRHTFSVAEARDPQACRTCHMGFDHAQWEMYSASKHGVRHDLKQNGVLPETAAAPTCQTCHMQGGNHEVRTAWGFLAVRLPMPDDEQWAADRATILQALGVLDLQGNPTALLDVVQSVDMVRMDQAAFDTERQKMTATCGQCHSNNFSDGELAKGDDMIRQADHLMAEAIREVAALYTDGILTPPDGGVAFPFLLTFHDASTVIEQTLFEMYLKHRMRTFQGTFHANPDYALWYGWSAMQRDLTEIREGAEDLRRHTAK